MSNADTMKEQGITLFNQHDYEAAARAFQQAKDAYGESDQHDMVAEMKVNIGLVHRELGESQQALELMQEALRTFEDMNDKMRTAQVLGNLGGVYQSLGDKKEAELSYRKAANLFRELGEEILYSDTMMALGGMQMRSFQLTQAAATYIIALEKRENLTGRLRIIKSLANLITRLSGGKA
jgi:tetratricopeptide (TPR) repeat protein